MSKGRDQAGDNKFEKLGGNRNGNDGAESDEKRQASQMGDRSMW
jgi:hypothetical protein